MEHSCNWQISMAARTRGQSPERALWKNLCAFLFNKAVLGVKRAVNELEARPLLPFLVHEFLGTSFE
jgi:hypothetical protein